MHILSIDPSTTPIGWAMFAIFEKSDPHIKVPGYGTLRPKGADWVERCQNIPALIKEMIIDSLLIKPAYVLIEQPYLGPKSNPKSILQLGIGTGVILAQFSDAKVRFVKGHKTKAKAIPICMELNIGKASNDCRDSISQGAYWIQKNNLLLYVEENGVKS